MPVGCNKFEKIFHVVVIHNKIHFGFVFIAMLLCYDNLLGAAAPCERIV
tara:strand:+ start:279 stop:425 length:147 start_codon:yes stop_codon:yes gene_type:complete